uniref:Uncharacterized protein n=1 Tax=Oryza sativa subsp. japonica TaxID=39947 RepID=Q6YY70_ORYSJ|nr:hypothetical protein [Oryza sativa Japonica Group]
MDCHCRLHWPSSHHPGQRARHTVLSWWLSSPLWWTALNEPCAAAYRLRSARTWPPTVRPATTASPPAEGPQRAVRCHLPLPLRQRGGRCCCPLSA